MIVSLGALRTLKNKERIEEKSNLTIDEYSLSHGVLYTVIAKKEAKGRVAWSP
ncbi:MAG: hypothetical protein RLQ12_02560 [Cyclobacteriaceae bacterium]